MSVVGTETRVWAGDDATRAEIRDLLLDDQVGQRSDPPHVAASDQAKS